MGTWQSRRGRGLIVMVLAGAVAFAVPALAAVVRGTPDDDRLTGTAKSDRLSGRVGDDRLSGKRGDDLLKGGPGDDLLIGGKGFDDLRGGPGDDVIRARDGEPDIIECGDGFDTAFVDSVEDGVLDCEEILEP